MTQSTYDMNVPLKFYFNNTKRLSIPLCAYRSQGKYVKKFFYDFDTYFITELFSDIYNGEYNKTEQYEYVFELNPIIVNLKIN